MELEGSLPCSQVPQVQGPVQYFERSCFFLQWEVVTPSSNPQAGGCSLYRQNFKIISVSLLVIASSEVFMAVKIQVEVFRVVTPWSVVWYQRFGGPCCLHLQFTRCHNPDFDLNLLPPIRTFGFRIQWHTGCISRLASRYISNFSMSGA
jgi:hypothetical protein